MRILIESSLIFECDRCKKKSLERANIKKANNKYPYGAGWWYLHRFTYKKSPQGQNSKHRDKHFCSAFCFKDFIDKEIQTKMLK